MRYIALFIGKIFYQASLFLNLGSGGTWPGEIALTLDPHILSSLSRTLKQGVIIIAGTNGKTTTSLMIKQILEHQGFSVIHNATGANLLNGVVSSFIEAADWSGQISADWGVFEVDENSLPAVVKYFKEQRLVVVLLNLFRDQLDRYGEVDVIAEKWQQALQTLDGKNATLILNADDPLIAHLGKGKKARYFGIDDQKHFLKEKEHAVDSTFCLNCGARLQYAGIYYSHIGIWKCPKCKEARPKPQVSRWDAPLPGLYNVYNTLAAVSVGKVLDIEDTNIKQSLAHFAPAFGRQEEFVVQGKTVKLFLSKNPAGYNASLRTVLELKPKALLLVLNDRIPDGRDVSWIWDVDFETIPTPTKIVVSGDRTFDMGVRIKYSRKSQITNHKSQTNSNQQNPNFVVEPDLKHALEKGLQEMKSGETLYVLTTYSAMLEVRKIIGGRKIL